MVISASAEGEQVTGSFEGCLSAAASAKGDLAVACLRGCYPTATAKWNLVAASVEGHCPAAAANARGDLAAACFKGRHSVTTAEGDLAAVSFKGHLSAAVASAKGELAVACLRSCYLTASAQWNPLLRGVAKSPPIPRVSLVATTNCECYDRFTVCCMLDTVTASCKLYMGRWHK